MTDRTFKETDNECEHIFNVHAHISNKQKTTQRI